MVSKKKKAKARQRYKELLIKNNPEYLLPEWCKKKGKGGDGR